MVTASLAAAIAGAQKGRHAARRLARSVEFQSLSDPIIFATPLFVLSKRCSKERTSKAMGFEIFIRAKHRTKASIVAQTRRGAAADSKRGECR
jgi:hypothetical protein